MRKLPLLFACAIALALGVAGIAQAVNSKQSMSVKLAKNKAGTAKAPKNIGKLTVDLAVAVDQTDPAFATKSTTLFFDKNLVFNSAKFKSCTEVQVRNHAAACNAAKVGSGFAQATAAGQQEDLTVTGYNGPKGKSLLLRVEGQAPLAIDSVIVGKLVKGSGAYGKKLVVTIPDNLQQPLTGLYATLTRFVTTVGGTQKKVPYIALKGCPANKKLQFKGNFVFTDGTKQSPKATAPCKK
jgi:hypothetical protein